MAAVSVVLSVSPSGSGNLEGCPGRHVIVIIVWLQTQRIVRLSYEG